MKRIYILFLLACWFSGMYAQKDIADIIDVRPVGKHILYNSKQVVYALPKNVVQVELTVKTTEYMTGPYAGYAEKLLNISEGVIVTDYSFHEVKDACVSRFSVIDSSQLYTISNINYLNAPSIQLNSDGVILAYNSEQNVDGYALASCVAKNINPAMEMPPFTDLGVKPFMYEKSETLYKKVKTDTNEIEVPYTQKKMVATTTEMDAEEAAAFIRKIRKRRSKLIFGLKDEVNAVDGKALELMLSELNKLEKKYLELFVGKEQSYEQKYYFKFEPTSGVMEEKKLLAWFSESYGVSLQKPDDRKGKFDQIVIGSSVLGSLPNLKIEMIDDAGKSPEVIKYGLYYRVPGQVRVSLNIGDQKVLQTQMQIAQKGYSVPLPAAYFRGDNISILYYPELGALKSITKENK